jgi:hypothetical protein
MKLTVLDHGIEHPFPHLDSISVATGADVLRKILRLRENRCSISWSKTVSFIIQVIPCAISDASASLQKDLRPQFLGKIMPFRAFGVCISLYLIDLSFWVKSCLSVHLESVYLCT